jgi:hypothetical protein
MDRNGCSSSVLAPKREPFTFSSLSRHGTPPSSSFVGVIFPSGKGRLRVDSNTRSRNQYPRMTDRLSIRRGPRCWAGFRVGVGWEQRLWLVRPSIQGEGVSELSKV